MATRNQLQRQIREELASKGYNVTMLNSWPAKATYYRLNGEAMPNLPADPWSMKNYLAKGFTLAPPEKQPEAPAEFTCGKCGRPCKSRIGRISHERACKKEVT